MATCNEGWTGGARGEGGGGESVMVRERKAEGGGQRRFKISRARDRGNTEKNKAAASSSSSSGSNAICGKRSELEFCLMMASEEVEDKTPSWSPCPLDVSFFKLTDKVF